jgi:hypothetical protein
MVKILAQSFYFSFRFFGEGIAEVLHGYFLAIANNIINDKIESITDPI